VVIHLVFTFLSFVVSCLTSFIKGIMKKRSRRVLEEQGNPGTSTASSPRSAEVSRDMSMQLRENIDLSMYEELSQRCQQLSDQLTAMQERYATLAESYGARNSGGNGNININSNSNSNSTSNSNGNPSNAANFNSSSVEYVIYKEPVPPFKAETPASQPLKRNQEVESWLRHVENGTQPRTDDAYIRAARSSCRGTADLIVNSPIFDGIVSWVEFKEKIRIKFRGTCSSTDFFNHLSEYKLAPGQAPVDFFVAIESVVYQGVRDYPRSVGMPDELIRRVFLQGLPQWLREALALKEEDSLQILVDAAQRCWSIRMSNAKCTERQAKPNETSRVRKSPSMYCSFHNSRNHSDEDCRGRQNVPSSSNSLRCYTCKEEGHISRNCPFSSARGARPFPASRAANSGGI